MTVERAKREIEKKYIQAKKMRFIRNPLAWALYQVWRMADAEDPRKDGDKL